MPVDLYAIPISMPCRMVHMTLEYLGVPYNYKLVDILKGEQMKPEYLKLNPQHTVPTLVDGDLTVTESRAAVMYLAAAYAKDDKFYPKNPKCKAKVDQRVFFEAGSVYKSTADVLYPKAFFDQPVPDSAVAKLHEVLSWTQDMVKPTGWFGGLNHLSPADICLLAVYSTLKSTGAVDLSKYAELNAWYDRAKKEIPNWDKCCGEGAAHFAGAYNK